MQQSDSNLVLLTIDDEESIRSSVAAFFEDCGYAVIQACDGSEGISMVRTMRPDIVITDIQMPRENGLEMMGHIRTHEPMIKTIYMSGDIDHYRAYLTEEKKKYQVSFFEKPFSMELLKKAMLEPTTGLRPKSPALSSH